MEKFVVGFFGDGPWAHQAFDKLIQDSTIQIAFVCARFDATDLILKQKALTHDIPFFIHNDINSEDFFAQVAFSKYDLFVSMSFNQIFKKNHSFPNETELLN